MFKRVNLGFTVFILPFLVHAYNPEQLESFKHTLYCEECDFTELNMSPEILGNSDISGANLMGTYFYGSSIEDLNLTDANLQGIIGLGLMLHNNNLTNANFSYGDLPNLTLTPQNRGKNVSFLGAGIDKANLSYSVLDAPIFTEASMSSASLYHVDWPFANLKGARLRSADLTFAKLQNASLENANLTNALLNHADLSGANLFGALVTEDQLRNVASVCNAILPDGSIGQCEAPFVLLSEIHEIADE